MCIRIRSEISPFFSDETLVDDFYDGKKYMTRVPSLIKGYLQHCFIANII